MSSAQSTVLAVDDNATIRKAISLRLGAKGFDVVTAQDGIQALDMLEDRIFDLMLLDLQMPQMRGDEVLRRVRDRYSATELPVIMLASSREKTDINRTLDLGANDYIVKPGDMPVLLARIRTQLALRDTVAQLREHSNLMRDIFSDTVSGCEAKKPMYQADTDTLLDKIDTSYRVPFDVLHDNTPTICLTINQDGTILHTNRFGARALGYRTFELIDRSILDLYVTEDRKSASDAIAAAINIPGRVHRWDIRQIKKDHEVVWMRNTARAVKHGVETMVLVTCEDIDDTYKLNDMLSFQQRHDDLTGLANRKTFERRLTRVIESAHSENTEHTLAVVDLDQFKLINDTCGHEAGDELLRQISKLLANILRKRDTLARIGGDEFAVLIEDCDSKGANSATEALRRAIETYDFEWEGRHYELSASVGVVPINQQCESTASALSMADTACYAAKESGRNTIHTYERDNTPVVARHGEMLWATRINNALTENRFDLTFQTITPLNIFYDTGNHYEVLVRMRDETGNLVLPGEFLPSAERYNLAGKLDRWVIKTLIDHLSDWPDYVANMNLACINLSGQSMGDDNMLKFIIDQFSRGVITPDKICFEITETAAIADLAQAKRFIQVLRESGCQFALDDFGSGFSSLTYLKQLPVDYLKIDGSFVRDITSNSTDLAMVKSINDIGHVMGKKTIAEFVEDECTLNLLRKLGVDFAQGYEISRPAPISELTQV